MPATLSPVTARAVGFVADRRPDAESLGRSLAEETGDPDRLPTSCARASPRSPTRSTSPVSAGSRPGSAICMACAGH